MRKETEMKILFLVNKIDENDTHPKGPIYNAFSLYLRRGKHKKKKKKEVIKESKKFMIKL